MEDTAAQQTPLPDQNISNIPPITPEPEKPKMNLISKKILLFSIIVIAGVIIVAVICYSVYRQPLSQTYSSKTPTTIQKDNNTGVLTTNTLSAGIIYYDKGSLDIFPKGKSQQVFLSEKLVTDTTSDANVPYVIDRSKQLLYFSNNSIIYKCSLTTIPCLPTVVYDVTKDYAQGGILNNSISLSPDGNKISFVIEKAYSGTVPAGSSAVDDNVVIYNLLTNSKIELSKTDNIQIGPADLEPMDIQYESSGNWLTSNTLLYKIRSQMGGQNYAVDSTKGQIDIKNGNNGTLYSDTTTDSGYYTIAQNNGYLAVEGGNGFNDSSTTTDTVYFIPLTDTINPGLASIFSDSTKLSGFVHASTTNGYASTGFNDGNNIIIPLCNGDGNDTSTSKGDCKVNVFNTTNNTLTALTISSQSTYKLSADSQVEVDTTSGSYTLYRFITNTGSTSSPLISYSYSLLNTANNTVLGFSVYSNQNTQINLY